MPGSGSRAPGAARGRSAPPGFRRRPLPGAGSGCRGCGRWLRTAAARYCCAASRLVTRPDQPAPTVVLASRRRRARSAARGELFGGPDQVIPELGRATRDAEPHHIGGELQRQLERSEAAPAPGKCGCFGDGVSGRGGVLAHDSPTRRSGAGRQGRARFARGLRPPWTTGPRPPGGGVMSQHTSPPRHAFAETTALPRGRGGLVAFELALLQGAGFRSRHRPSPLPVR
jgi:hypothetical protein